MAVLAVPYAVSIACWFVFEMSLTVRDLVHGQGRHHNDRGTRAAVTVAFLATFLLVMLMPTVAQPTDTPAPMVFAVVGLAVFWTGLALRAWSVITLGRSFRTMVRVDKDQAVVTRGPYRWVRHPSYTGLLLIAVGFGIGAGNWLSMVVAVLLPVAGLLPRIAVEEAELTRVLGEPYAAYRRATRRLLPGLW